MFKLARIHTIIRKIFCQTHVSLHVSVEVLRIHVYMALYSLFYPDSRSRHPWDMISWSPLVDFNTTLITPQTKWRLHWCKETALCRLWMFVLLIIVFFVSNRRLPLQWRPLAVSVPGELRQTEPAHGCSYAAVRSEKEESPGQPVRATYRAT